MQPSFLAAIGGLGVIVGLVALARNFGGYENKFIAKLLMIVGAVLLAAWAFVVLPATPAWMITCLDCFACGFALRIALESRSTTPFSGVVGEHPSAESLPKRFDEVRYQYRRLTLEDKIALTIIHRNPGIDIVQFEDRLREFKFDGGALNR